jgi:hypothetical protein
MGKTVLIALGILALMQTGSMSCYAGGHGHGHGNHVGFSGGIWVGPGWGAVWPGPYYPYYVSPVVVQPRYEEYVAPAPEAEEQDLWYYCRKPEGYHPYIKKCPGGWMKVVPPPEAPEGEE